MAQWYFDFFLPAIHPQNQLSCLQENPVRQYTCETWCNFVHSECYVINAQILYSKCLIAYTWQSCLVNNFADFQDERVKKKSKTFFSHWWHFLTAGSHLSSLQQHLILGLYYMGHQTWSLMCISQCLPMLVFTTTLRVADIYVRNVGCHAKDLHPQMFIFFFWDLLGQITFAICNIVHHCNMDSIQNPSTVTNQTMESFSILLPHTLPWCTTWQITN